MITVVSRNLIWYEYKGDEIAWDGTGFISLLSEGIFDTLESMDEFWKSYWEATSSVNGTESLGFIK
jgi:hypothetical protein